MVTKHPLYACFFPLRITTRQNGSMKLAPFLRLIGTVMADGPLIHQSPPLHSAVAGGRYLQNGTTL